MHEKGDRTALIGDADVIFPLTEPVKKKTLDNGATNFTIPGYLVGSKASINAKKAGYKPRNPIRITLRTNAQEFIALEREDGDIPLDVRSAFDPYGQKSFINVPPRPSTLIGRDDDLLAVKKRIGLIEPKADLRTLTVIRGWPGVGKSTLLAELVYDPALPKRFPDGVLWASLGQSPDILSIFDIWSWARQVSFVRMWGTGWAESRRETRSTSV